MSSRLKNIYAALEQKNLDGLIVSNPANISYLTEFQSRDSYLLASKKENIYFTDSRYIEEVKKRLKGTALVKKSNGSVFKLIADACLNLGLKAIGFEERYLAYAEHKKIKEGLKKIAKLIPVYGLIEEFRQIKEPGELAKIKKAIQITAQALKFIKGFISCGRKEIEVVAELERFIRYHGTSNSSFDIIVAAGCNSSFPHHISSGRKIKKNEPVLIDMGVDYFGYKCDLTRVFFLDKINVLNQKIYDIVLTAQDRAIEQIRPGKKIAEIDAAARQYITKKGYGGFFGHSLGHGVGLEVHEEPHISGKESGILMEGMVITIEPAIYLPHKFGIRIEDMVLVTKKGYEVLSGPVNK
jgi:Xaa-Pro aminopeptidase